MGLPAPRTCDVWRRASRRPRGRAAGNNESKGSEADIPVRTEKNDQIRALDTPVGVLRVNTKTVVA